MLVISQDNFDQHFQEGFKTLNACTMGEIQLIDLDVHKIAHLFQYINAAFLQNKYAQITMIGQDPHQLSTFFQNTMVRNTACKTGFQQFPINDENFRDQLFCCVSNWMENPWSLLNQISSEYKKLPRIDTGSLNPEERKRELQNLNQRLNYLQGTIQVLEKTADDLLDYLRAARESREKSALIANTMFPNSSEQLPTAQVPSPTFSNSDTESE